MRLVSYLLYVRPQIGTTITPFLHLTGIRLRFTLFVSKRRTPTSPAHPWRARATVSRLHRFAHPASANRITNDGFEAGGFTGWTVTAGGSGGGPINHHDTS